MLLGEVAANLEELALQRGVRLEVGRTPEKQPLLGDVEQVKIALIAKSMYFIGVWLRPNENKMSDGHRERA